MGDSVGRPRELGLSAALGISVVLHGLLLLLGLGLPLGRRAEAAVQPEETLLRFNFAPQAEAEQTGDPGRDDLPLSPPTLPQPMPSEPEPSLPTPPLDEEPVPPQPRVDLPDVALPDPSEARDPSGDDLDSPTPIEEVAPTDGGGSDAPGPRDALEFPDVGVKEVPAPSRSEPARPGPEGPSLAERMEQSRRALDRAREAQPTPPRPSRNVFVPDSVSLPSTGFGAGNLTFESTDYDWSDYARQIYIAIWRAWHNRLYYSTDEFEKWAYQVRRAFLNHQSGVRFVIERSGEVTSISLESASGCDPLDQSAMDALAEVILPPLPADFPRDQEVVHARFIARGEIRVMRSSLSQLKRMGYF